MFPFLSFLSLYVCEDGGYGFIIKVQSLHRPLTDHYDELGLVYKRCIYQKIIRYILNLIRLVFFLFS